LKLGADEVPALVHGPDEDVEYETV